MRVLLDENLPHDLAQALAEHDVVNVQGLGWSGLKNGELLRRADGHIDAFITMDSNLQFQQRWKGLHLASWSSTHTRIAWLICCRSST